MEERQRNKQNYFMYPFTEKFYSLRPRALFKQNHEKLDINLKNILFNFN